MSDYGSTPPPPPPQPAYGGGWAQSSLPPPNYLLWAILSTFLCCQPLGIASIVFSTQVNSKWAMGDVAGAQDASEKARQFAIWSAIAFGAIFVIVAVIFGVLALSGALLLNSTSQIPS